MTNPEDPCTRIRPPSAEREGGNADDHDEADG